MRCCRVLLSCNWCARYPCQPQAASFGSAGKLYNCIDIMTSSARFSALAFRPRCHPRCPRVCMVDCQCVARRSMLCADWRALGGAVGPNLGLQAGGARRHGLHCAPHRRPRRGLHRSLRAPPALQRAERGDQRKPGPGAAMPRAISSRGVSFWGDWV